MITRREVQVLREVYPERSRRAQDDTPRRGFALMAALWIVVLVGITGYELSARSRSQRLGVANALETSQARAAAEAGLETARAELERRLPNLLQARAQRGGEVMPDPWANIAQIRRDTLRLGDERTSWSVYDAGARVQINLASEDDVRRLLLAMPLDASIADRIAQRIMDWKDADQLHRTKGAERDDYLRAGARVLPSDAAFVSVEELRDVEGVSDDLYRRLAPTVSVRGSGQINLNTASRVVIRSLPGFGDEAVDALLRARQSGRPIRTLDDLIKQLSYGARAAMEEAIPELVSRVVFETREVVAETSGWVDGSAVRVHGEAVYERSGDAVLTSWRRVGR